MANIEVTSSTNRIKAKMNVYATAIGIGEGDWPKSIVSVKLRTTFIEVNVLGERDWTVSDVEDLPNNILQVDKVNGIAPSSLQDLFDKLSTALS
jgi:hypothetical protein